MQVKLSSDELEKINAAGLSGSVDDVAHYAILLGLKLIESGLDTDELIRSLQEPGSGLDIHLIMAKKKSRGSEKRVAGAAAYAAGRDAHIDWASQNIPEDAYDEDFE